METQTENEYAQARSEWHAFGEYDLRENPGYISYQLAELRESLEGFETRFMRAYFLGALRGYREAVRTLVAGRWST